MKRCPFCAETIQAEAIKCRFCGEFLNTARARSLEQAQKGGLPADQGAEKDGSLFRGRPSLWGVTGAVIRGIVFGGLMIIVLRQPVVDKLNKYLDLNLSESQIVNLNSYKTLAIVVLILLILLRLAVHVLKLKTVHYEVNTDRIEWTRGILDRRIDNIDMFRVIDLRLRRSILDCILGIGTVTLITSDKTDPEFRFAKIRDPRNLYNIIKKASLEADQKRGVVHLE
ncbi:MAG: PH domain-containing protein [Planctomycetota bacterium]